MPSIVVAGGPAGLWKHTENPGWIEIDSETGEGTVVRNEKYPEREGRVILKDLAATDEEGVWTAQIYAETLGEFRKAEVSLPEANRMNFTVKVGFISRTVEWQRVESLPAETGE